jgi:hypothetical protein
LVPDTAAGARTGRALAAPRRRADWHDAHAHAFACQLAAHPDVPPRWCLVFNPGAQPARFRLPHGPWRLAADSSGAVAAGQTTHADEGAFDVPSRALLLLRRDPAPGDTHSQETSR